MKSEENKKLVRQFIEQVVNTGNLEKMREFVADDVVMHNAPPHASPGLDVYRQQLQRLRQTYGNFRLTVALQIAEDDLVVTRVMASVTQKDAERGLLPAGGPLTITGINIDRIAGGKIVEHWGEAGTATSPLSLRQRYVSAPDQAPAQSRAV